MKKKSLTSKSKNGKGSGPATYKAYIKVKNQK